MSSDDTVHVTRFGDYAFDPVARELRKFDRRIPLPDQAIQILAVLLERPGEVVSRDELIARLWPDGTVVDFEHAINSSIRRLRAALNESADRPRYIETLPKRGYRFIAAVAPSIGTAPSPGRTLASPMPAPARYYAVRLWKLTASILVLAAALVITRVRSRSDAPIGSIAILPFVNSSRDARIDYLADGMTEQIINRLSGVRHIRVIARTSAFKFKGVDVDARQAGRTLGVAAVATGRVALSGDDLTVQAELVEVADGSQLWGDKYTRHIADVQALEAEMASEIAGRLRLRLTGDAEKRLVRRYTSDSEAYQLYLKAADAFYELGDQPQRYLEQAIARDPGFALAYAQMARLYWMRVVGRTVDGIEGLTKAKALATRALALDETLGVAHLVLSEVRRTLDWDWPGAEKEIKLGIEDTPGYGHSVYSDYLLQVGRTQESWPETQLAVQTDPLSPAVRLRLVQYYICTGQYQRAEEASKAPGLPPEYASEHRGYALAGQGRFAESIALLRGNARAGPLGHLGEIYVRAGNRTEAERIRSELQRRARETKVGAYEVAFISAALGQADEAFRWLDLACAYRDPGLKYLKLETALNPVRSDPRFSALLRRVGLPQ